MSAKFEAAHQTLNTVLDVLTTCGIVYSGHFEVRSSKTNNGIERISINYYTPDNNLRDVRNINDKDTMIDVILETLDTFIHEGYTFGEL